MHCIHLRSYRINMLEIEGSPPNRSSTKSSKSSKTAKIKRELNLSRSLNSLKSLGTLKDEPTANFKEIPVNMSNPRVSIGRTSHSPLFQAHSRLSPSVGVYSPKLDNAVQEALHTDDYLIRLQNQIVTRQFILFVDKS